ncbi:MAG: chemotaxis protein CheW [Bdellovibrionota bacterium]
MTSEFELHDGDRFLNFVLGDNQYAIPLLTVVEVIAVPSFTPFPKSPKYFVGITDLRGQVIPVLDLRKKLGIELSKDNSNEAVIIIRLGEYSLGVLVDSVESVLTPKSDEVSPPPSWLYEDSSFILAVFKMNLGMVLLIDIINILDQNDWKSLKKALGKAA